MGIRSIAVTSGETNEAAPGTESPLGDSASVEEKRIDLSRAARGAGSPVDGHYDAGNDESDAGHDPNADDADEHADEHPDVDDEHVDEQTDDFDPGYSIHALGKSKLDPAADDDADLRHADVPAHALESDGDGSGRDVDEPSADRASACGGRRTDKPDGFWR
jgi:hypothetical protein